MKCKYCKKVIKEVFVDGIKCFIDWDIELDKMYITRHTCYFEEVKK
jgi:cyanate lyase